VKVVPGGRFGPVCLAMREDRQGAVSFCMMDFACTRDFLFQYSDSVSEQSILNLLYDGRCRTTRWWCWLLVAELFNFGKWNEEKAPAAIGTFC